MKKQQQANNLTLPIVTISGLFGYLFDLILYVPVNIFQPCRCGSSWFESVEDIVFNKDTTQWTQPANPLSRVKHSTTEPPRGSKMFVCVSMRQNIIIESNIWANIRQWLNGSGPNLRKMGGNKSSDQCPVPKLIGIKMLFHMQILR